MLRTEIPPACPPNVDKGYWDAVVCRLALLAETEALRIAFRGDQITSSMKSSLFTAASRAGRKVTILVRGACLFAWLSVNARRSDITRRDRRSFARCAGAPLSRRKAGRADSSFAAGSVAATAGASEYVDTRGRAA